MTMIIHTLKMGFSSLAYLVESESGLVLVDAGAPGDERRVLERMKAIGRDDLRLIFITHGHLDHYGCAGPLRRQTGAPIAIHHADAEAMAQGETRLGSARGRGRFLYAVMPLVEPFLRPEPTPADLLLDDGQELKEFGLDARLLHTPGHTVGSSCLLVEERLAFAGDLLTTTGPPRLQRFYAQDWSLLPKSLGRLQALKPEWVYPGHGRHPLSGADLQKLAADGE